MTSIAASYNLWHNFETHHSEFKQKETEYFKCRHDEVLKGPNLFVTAFQTRIEKATEASYRVRYHMALGEETHTVAERLIKPCS